MAYQGALEIICADLDFDEDLYHHGIAGMRWGKRNGPPYPLARTSSGEISDEQERRNMESNQSYYENYVKERRKNRLKTAGKVALGAAVAGGAAYGAYKLGKHLQENAKLQSVKGLNSEEGGKNIMDAARRLAMMENPQMYSNKELNKLLEDLQTEQKVKGFFTNASKSQGKELVDSFLKNMAAPLAAGGGSLLTYLLLNGFVKDKEVINPETGETLAIDKVPTMSREQLAKWLTKNPNAKNK